MGEVVNLRRARKAKARGERETSAAENRAKFGVSLHEKQRGAALQSKAVRSLDGHRRELQGSDNVDVSGVSPSSGEDGALDR